MSDLHSKTGARPLYLDRGPAKVLRALVADDDRDMRTLVSTVLRNDGFVVSEARDGRELIEIVDAAAREEDASLDLIISDVNMPGVSGLEALAQLAPRLGQTVVIVMTAFADERTHADARRVGAVGVLDKPFDLDDLRTVVVHYLGRR